ncbi:MlaD family protein [Liberibacter crescens]|nr:MlaD family protein [Liberibacter crescens]AMC12879.1 organic solvent ABC transporter substrate-binding protein [Liberibacter crescens]
METNVNYTIVGIFTVFILSLGFFFTYWFSSHEESKGPTHNLIIRIPGSTNGLSVGSPVRFNGITVGSVTSLSLDQESPAYSIATTRIRANVPIYPSTKAVLEIQGLTGTAYIELSGAKKESKTIFALAEETKKPASITAYQSSVTNLLTTADAILDKANTSVFGIQEFVKDARQPLTKTVHNVEIFSKALADNADNIDQLLKSVSSFSNTFNGFSKRATSTLEAVENLVRAVDTQKVDSIINNSKTISINLAQASSNLDKTISVFQETTRSFQKLGEKALSSVEHFDSLITTIDKNKISSSVDNITVAIANARESSASIKSITEQLSQKQNEMTQTIHNFNEMSQHFNSASVQLESVIEKANKWTNSEEGGSLIEDARQTLKSFKTTSDNLNRQIAPLMNNMNHFSNIGFRDLQTLINDIRRTTNNFNDAITNLDNNPQRLLFGGNTIKEYQIRKRY